MSLTVRNKRDRSLDARLSVRPDAGAKAGWFAIDGAATTVPNERNVTLAPNATLTIKVAISVPPDAAPGNHVFLIRIAAEDNPDDDFADSPSVAFAIAPSAPPAKAHEQRFPWWAVTVAAALVIVFGGGTWWATRSRPAVNVVGELAATATQRLANAGFLVDQVEGEATGRPQTTVIKQDNNPDGKHVTLTIDPGHYERGAGVQPTCPTDTELLNGRCYSQCGPGNRTVGPNCALLGCPAGTYGTSYGNTGACLGSDPIPGWQCETIPHFIRCTPPQTARPSTAGDCANSMELNGALCYPKCRAGFTGSGSTCTVASQ
ncbi:hypothetical protein [Bradyrhizobium sp. SZCCHNS3051]|uniref:hypothetical protein n=1 Tax=Bradyrhizobium sp. SZCCHNS3051 TaxID=3057320 RepID=UPI002916B34C|nr:hypothetical protein [Bradyrhizobium sp. SZCCHNS3051]